jgi:hypothetical protein
MISPGLFLLLIVFLLSPQKYYKNIHVIKGIRDEMQPSTWGLNPGLSWRSLPGLAEAVDCQLSLDS